MSGTEGRLTGASPPFLQWKTPSKLSHSMGWPMTWNEFIYNHHEERRANMVINDKPLELNDQSTEGYKTEGKPKFNHKVNQWNIYSTNKDGVIKELFGQYCYSSKLEFLCCKNEFFWSLNLYIFMNGHGSPTKRTRSNNGEICRYGRRIMEPKITPWTWIK